MKKTIIFLALALLLIQSVSAGFNYRIEMQYDNGNISINEIGVKFSHYKPVNYFNDKYPSYEIKVDNLIENFSVQLIQSIDIYDNKTGLMSGGVEKLNKSYFYIEVPYNPYAKEIQIIDLNGNVLIKKSVIEFSRNFNYEEYKKSLGNKTLDNWNRDNINNTSGEVCTDCIETVKSNIPGIIVIILLTILLGLLVYYLIKSKK